MILLNWLLAALTASAIGTGAIVVRSQGGAPAVPDAVPRAAVPVQSAVPVRTDDDFVKLPAGRDGIVAEVLVKKGTRVGKGDVLVRLSDRFALLDRDWKAAKVDVAKAEMEAAEKNYDGAKRRYEVATKLLASSATSQEDPRAVLLALQRCKSEVKVKEAGIAVAEIEWRQAELILNVHKIRASQSGVVTAIRKRAGEAVEESETVILLDPDDEE